MFEKFIPPIISFTIIRVLPHFGLSFASQFGASSSYCTNVGPARQILEVNPNPNVTRSIKIVNMILIGKKVIGRTTHPSNSETFCLALLLNGSCKIIGSVLENGLSTHFLM